MLRIVGEALWSPVKHYQVTLLLFVLWALFVIPLRIDTSPLQIYMPHPMIKTSYVAWALCIYVALIISSVIVNLHRKVVFGDSRSLIRLIPTNIDITYAFYYGALVILLYFLAIAAILGWALLKVILTRAIGEDSVVVEIAVWVISALVLALVLQFLIRLCLTFPRVAINLVSKEWPAEVRRKTSLFSANSFSILAVLGLAVGLGTGFEFIRRDLILSGQTNYIEGQVFLLLIFFMGVCTSVMMATVLSVVYRDTILPIYRKKKDVDA